MSKEVSRLEEEVKKLREKNDKQELELLRMGLTRK
jgi:hypothetical protein